MEEEMEIVFSSRNSRKESRLKKTITLKDHPNLGGDSKMVVAMDHLPQGMMIKEVSGSTTMMSDGLLRTKILSSTEHKVSVASDRRTKGKCVEITLDAELTQEKRPDDVCIKAKISRSKNVCGGLSEKKANKRKVAKMHETNPNRSVKIVTEDDRELVGYSSSCHKSRKSAVHPIVEETGPQSQPREATLVDEVIHQFSRLNGGDASEDGCGLADFDLKELLKELKASDKAREHDPDEPGLVLIKFV